MAHTPAVHPGENAPRTDCSPPATTGKTRVVLDDDVAQDPDGHASPLDDRLPRRPERRHGVGLRARTTTRVGTAWRPTPTASSTSPRHAGFWLRDENGQSDRRAFKHISLGRLHVPQRRSMMKPRTWSDILARDDRRPRRPRLVRVSTDRRPPQSRAARLPYRCPIRSNRPGRSLDRNPGCGNHGGRRRRSEHRPRGLRLHGPDPLERATTRQRLLRSRLPARAQGGLCGARRERAGVRRQVGL